MIAKKDKSFCGKAMTKRFLTIVVFVAAYSSANQGKMNKIMKYWIYVKQTVIQSKKYHL